MDRSEGPRLALGWETAAASAVEAMKRGQAADAEAFARSALASRPDQDDLIFTLAWVLYESGKIAEAEAEYRSLVARAPRHAGAWFNIGNLLDNTDRHAEALHAWHKAAKLGHQRAANKLP